MVDPTNDLLTMGLSSGDVSAILTFGLYNDITSGSPGGGGGGLTSEESAILAALGSMIENIDGHWRFKLFSLSAIATYRVGSLTAEIISPNLTATIVCED